MTEARRTPSVRRATGIALLTLFGWTGAAWAAAETFNTALPVAEGDFVYRQQFLFLRSTDDPTSANREVEALGGVSVLGYGVTPDFTLFAILPYLDKRVDLTASGGRIGRSTRGIGDFSLIGRYTAYQDNFRGGNFRIAPFVGLQMPTGESTASDRFGRIRPPIQLGSGSWKPFAGVVATYQTLDYPGQFNAPGGVGLAENGDLYVADFYNQRVQERHADGTFVRQWGTTGERGHGAGAFIYPTDVALDRNGNLYVADGYANRIQVFDAAGNFVRKWGAPLAIGIPGGFNGWFRVVTSIAFGPKGDLFAADFYNHRFQKFTPDGAFLTSFGGNGSGPGQFDHAIAVAVADDGAVFAVDFLNDRIEKWRPK